MTFLQLNSPVVILLLLSILGMSAAFVMIPAVRASFNMSASSFGARMAILLLLTLAVAEPVLETEHEESSALALLDISDSMDTEAADESLGLVRGMEKAGVTIEIVPFAEQSASVSVPVAGAASFHRLQESWNRLNIGATNLENAAAALLSRKSGSILLLSDGQENKGDIRKILPTLQAAGFRIFPIIPSRGSQGSAAFHLSNLHAPLVAAAQKSIDVRASLQNTSGQEQRGLLEIFHDSKVIFSDEVSVAPHSESLIVAQSDPSTEGIKEITARLTPSQSSVAASSQTIYLSGEARERVLLVSGSAEDERFLKELLQSQAYQLETIVASGRGTSLPDLNRFSAVLFNNVAHEQLAKTSVGLLEGYVKGGGGFIMLGGNRSFGLGGYKDTVVEDILPVELLPPQTIKKRLNLAVQLVIDKSRSMSENDKIEYAKEAARASIRALKDDDYVGVIGFDASPFVVVELGLVATTRDKALERVGRLFPAGRTNALPAIEEARRKLMRVNAGRKHMIILTDGKIPDEGPYYIEMVKQLRLLGITVSTVLMGGDSDPGMLETMANVGGGAFYQTSDPRSLPKIFVTDLKVGTGEQTMREEEYLVRFGTAERRSTDISAFPPIRGYVQTKAKKASQLELIAYDGNKAEPLLVSWKYGRGTSIAFTSDANGRWSSGWVPWPKFGKFWNDLLETARQNNNDAKNIRFDLRYAVERGQLMLDLSIFSDKAPGQVAADIAMPDGTKRKIDFLAVSPGHYRSSLAGISAGKYILEGRVDGRNITPVAFALPGTLFGEQKSAGYNLPLLHAIADGSNGSINPSAKEIRSNVYKSVQHTDLRFLFIALALILYCLEVLVQKDGPVGIRTNS